MRLNAFANDGTVRLTRAAMNEVVSIVRWGNEVADHIEATDGNDPLGFGRSRILAARRLAARSNQDTLRPQDVKDFKKLRGLAVSATGRETMMVDRLL